MAKRLALLFFSLFFLAIANGQNVSIRLGKTTIPQNGSFTISVIATNEGLNLNSEFPQITGFRTGGQSQSHSTNFVNGKSSSSITLSQTYYPTKQGTFTLKPFSISVNNKKINSKGATITVTAPQQRQQRRSMFDDFFGNNSREQYDFQEVNDQLKLKVKTSKRSVYKNEGVLVQIDLYGTQQDFQLFEFTDDVSKEILQIQESLKLQNSWIEEKFSISKIETQQENIDGKTYYKIPIYKAFVFPSKAKPLKIPSLSLSINKYKVAQNRFGQYVKGEPSKKKLYSPSYTINVKPLPSHPLSESVAVGSFKLKETLSENLVTENNSFTYEFKISGTGNLNYIPNPTTTDEAFSFLPPKTKLYKSVKGDMLSGTKKFTYDIIANKQGEYKLGDEIQWIYFNTKKEQYDTLRSTKKIVIQKSLLPTQQVAIEQTGTDNALFYQQIFAETQQNGNGLNGITVYLNILILLILVLIGIILWKTRTNE